jgi:hypothetical protein
MLLQGVEEVHVEERLYRISLSLSIIMLIDHLDIKVFTSEVEIIRFFGEVVG